MTQYVLFLRAMLGKLHLHTAFHTEQPALAARETSTLKPDKGMMFKGNTCRYKPIFFLLAYKVRLGHLYRHVISANGESHFLIKKNNTYLVAECFRLQVQGIQKPGCCLLIFTLHDSKCKSDFWPLTSRLHEANFRHLGFKKGCNGSRLSGREILVFRNATSPTVVSSQIYIIKSVLAESN